MKITKGNLIPINYELYPVELEESLMAFVFNIEDDFLALCPVHSNLDIAGYYDLIIPPEDNSLEILLVLMTNLIKYFPKTAIEQDFRKTENQDLINQYKLTEEEKKKAFDDFEQINKSGIMNESFNFLRGRILRRNSFELNRYNELSLCWDKFLLASQIDEISNRISDFSDITIVQKVLQFAKTLVQESIYKPEDELATFSKVSSNEILPNAANIVLGDKKELGESSREICKTFKTELANIIEDSDVPEDYKIKLSKVKDNDISGLFELLLRLYPSKSGENK